MILYFSGTGNSKYAAQRIAEALDDTLFCINDRIRAKDRSPVKTGEQLVIVAPAYAWRIPRIVHDWLLSTELIGAKQAWFVMTCGSEIGNAAKYNQRLCQAKNLEYMGTTQIIMPENYIAMFNAPQPDEARKIVAFAAPRNNFYDRFMSGPVNPIFYRVFVKAKAFTVNSACTGCGRCAQLCPTGNIALQSNAPIWGKACTHCMACICYCPAEAIEYGKKSLGKPRYHFEAL